MVLRTILSFYDTRDGIQTHTYASALVKLLLIWLHGLLLFILHWNEVLRMGLQELIVLQISVVILLKVSIITQVGNVISLDVFTFLLQVLDLSLLVLDGLLQGGNLGAEVSDGVVLLGALLAK